jgi:hypothetical protein
MLGVRTGATRCLTLRSAAAGGRLNVPSESVTSGVRGRVFTAGPSAATRALSDSGFGDTHNAVRACRAP